MSAWLAVGRTLTDQAVSGRSVDSPRGKQTRGSDALAGRFGETGRIGSGHRRQVLAATQLEGEAVLRGSDAVC